MSIETEAAALFAEGNPVPDIETLEPAQVDAAAYLVVLEQRNRGATRLDTRPAGPEHRSLRPGLWLRVAVAAVVVGALGLLLVSEATEGPPSATTPSPPATVTASLETFEEIWAAGGIEIQFAGGVYAMSVDGGRSDSGHWTFGDGEVTLTSGAGSAVCPPGAVGVYEYAFVDEETLTLTGLSDECITRPGLGAHTITLTRNVDASTGDAEWDATNVFVSPVGPSGVAPGEYRTGRFIVPFRFDIDAGWTSFHRERSDAVALASLDPETTVEIHVFEPATVAGTLQFLRVASPIAETTHDGARGFAWPLDPSQPAVLFSDPLDGDYVVVPGTEYWLYVFDVNGTPVTIIHQFADEAGRSKGADLIRGIDWKDSSVTNRRVFP